MNLLLKKDLYTQRFSILTAVALWTVGPILVWIFWIFRDLRDRSSAGVYIQVMGMLGGVATVLVTALLGGASFAAERQDRSADFLAMLPIRRSTILARKLTLSLTILLVLWVIPYVVCLFGMVLANQMPSHLWFDPYGNTSSALPLIVMFEALSFMVFAAAWLLSSELSGPYLSALLSIFWLGLVCAVLAIYVIHLRDSSPEFTILMFLYVSCGIGVIFFALGIANYLRRIEP